MTIALKIGNEDSQVQGFIYLDAVTRYDKDLSGKVTSFPVDSGANISDHFIANNPKFTLEGIVSDVDITGGSALVSLNGEKPLNSRNSPTSTQISPQQNALQFLPSSVKQFFERSSSAVAVDAFTQTNIPIVEMLFEELLRGTYYNSADNRWRHKMTPTTLYEMDGANFSNAKTDLIITNVSFSEDPDSGDALRISLTLEKVRFVTLEMEEVGKNAKSSTQNKLAGTKNKGTPATETGKTNTDDPSKNTNTSKASIATGLKSAIESSKQARAVQRGPGQWGEQ